MDYRCIVCHDDVQKAGYLPVKVSGQASKNVICNRDVRQVGDDIPPATYRMFIGLMPNVDRR